MKERLLVDLFRPVGMTNEDDLDMPIAPRQKHIEQHVEALGQVLHVFGHRARHVHQTEHDGLGDRLRHDFEAAVADIDRIDERNPANLGLQRLDLGHELGAPRLVAIGEFGFELGDRLGPRPPQRHPARQRKAHRAADREVGRRARGRIARPAQPLALHFGELSLGEIRQFEVVEEQIDEFIAAQHEPEGVLAVAFAGPGSFLPAFAGARQNVAFDEFLVAGQHHVACAAFASKARFIHPVERDRDLAAFQDILDVAAL